MLGSAGAIVSTPVYIRQKTCPEPARRAMSGERWMVNPLRFDGRVAIVTGSGGNPSLGRAHAMLLAARGASVVVNDIGADPKSPGFTGTVSAETVVDEIRAAGGIAVADTHSVASEDGAAAIVASAIRHFGQIDILVNNAAISLAAPLDVMTPHDFRRHIEVNLMGGYYMCRAAWPHMKRRKYGRVVNITSSAMTGFADQAAYATSKGGLWSLTRALAAEGGAFGIKVNAVSPGAFTRLVASLLEDDSPLLQYSREHLPPELASPALAYLCHDSCPVTGECIDSAGGQVQRSYISRTKGVTDPALTIETVAARWEEIMATADAEIVGVANLDTAAWKIRPYAGER
jgi:NAD(P)-dependent dehydrogenase (short-subunit alcohol dehydrogenase family)